MLDSRETYVRYTMPLGLHHLIGGDHYAPMPENTDPRRADWSATYYHRADATGVGYDRTGAAAAPSINTAPAAGVVERSRDDAGRAAALVPPAAVGLPDEVGPHAVGRAGAPLHARRGGSQRTGAAMDRPARQVDEERYQAVLARLRRQSETPRRGATSACASSRPRADRDSAGLRCRTWLHMSARIASTSRPAARWYYHQGSDAVKDLSRCSMRVERGRDIGLEHRQLAPSQQRRLGAGEQRAGRLVVSIRLVQASIACAARPAKRRA